MCPEWCCLDRHIMPILIEIHWLPVRQRILFKILCLTYCSLNNSAPTYIQSLITKTNTYLVTMLPSQTHTSCPPCKHSLLRRGRAFSRFAPFQFNQLPEPLKLSPTFAAFKSGLKTHLFKCAYFWLLGYVLSHPCWWGPATATSGISIKVTGLPA